MHKSCEDDIDNLNELCDDMDTLLMELSGYVPEYFSDKWDYPEELFQVRKRFDELKQRIWERRNNVS